MTPYKQEFIEPMTESATDLGISKRYIRTAKLDIKAIKALL